MHKTFGLYCYTVYLKTSLPLFCYSQTIIQRGNWPFGPTCQCRPTCPIYNLVLPFSISIPLGSSPCLGTPVRKGMKLVTRPLSRGFCCLERLWLEWLNDVLPDQGIYLYPPGHLEEYCGCESHQCNLCHGSVKQQGQQRCSVGLCKVTNINNCIAKAVIFYHYFLYFRL